MDTKTDLRNAATRRMDEAREQHHDLHAVPANASGAYQMSAYVLRSRRTLDIERLRAKDTQIAHQMNKIAQQELLILALMILFIIAMALAVPAHRLGV